MRHIKRTTILAIAAATALTIGAAPGFASGEGDGCDDSTTTTAAPATTQPATTAPATTQPVITAAFAEPVITAAAVVVTTMPPPAAPVVAPAALSAQAAPTKPVLPATGTDTGTVAATAAALIAAGAALASIRRRPA